MNKIKPVVFKNRDGLKLFGMYHQPDESRKKDIGIILLSPGVKTRVAPHRLYNKIASQLVAMGYPVFRFDFYGLGDSEGEIEEEFVADLYGSVAVGRYVNDTSDAINWMEKEYNVSRVILGGLCGGAITGLLAGQDDERVVGLFGFGIPVSLYGTDIDKSKYISQGQLKSLRSGYLKKIADPQSWVRLLTMKSDLKVIVKVILQPFRKKKIISAVDVQDREGKNESSTVDTDFNPLFAPAFFKMATKPKNIMIIYSGADRLAWEFEEKFQDPYQQKMKNYSEGYRIYTIENANHILSDKKWHEEMMTELFKWLNVNYHNSCNVSS